MSQATSNANAGARSGVIQIATHSRVEFKDITSTLQMWISESGCSSGLLHLFVPHTTAAILVNENDDPSLATDFDEFLAKLAPRGLDYHHNDGNCDAHLKASLIGSAKTLMIEGGRLVLGTWQGVFFCEFDGPRHRSLRLKITPD
jgi:secondary thiamine-phosphate synthase enzyme